MGGMGEAWKGLCTGGCGDFNCEKEICEKGNTSKYVKRVCVCESLAAGVVSYSNTTGLFHSKGLGRDLLSAPTTKKVNECVRVAENVRAVGV